MEQVLAPGVEHGEKADLSTEVLGIGGDGAQSLRRSPEQDTIELSLVLIGNCCNLLWYGDDHVEVLGVQKLGLAILEPLSPGERLAFWAMPIGARVVSVALMATVVTLLQMAAQGSGAYDGAFDTTVPGDGVYDLRVLVTDKAGNAGSDTVGSGDIVVVIE